MNYTCRVCANSSNNRPFQASEKMFGWGDVFPYFQCGKCGCLQIETVPEDIGRHYPPHYYSFHVQPIPQRGLRAFLAGRRDRAKLTKSRWIGAWLPRGRIVRPDLACLVRLPMFCEMRVLDVGCGRGQLLSVLHRAGFRNLLGVDPFLPADMEVVPGLTVRRQPLETVEGKFDLIMFHHVLEHIEDGRAVLSAARERLLAGGKILVRVPTADCIAWERYRENWVSVDAPRHFFLHTHGSFRLLAKQAGLNVDELWCDSTSFQFWASELYKKGIALTDQKGRYALPEEHFSSEQLAGFERKTLAVNAANRGDQFCAVLTPVAR